MHINISRWDEYTVMVHYFDKEFRRLCIVKNKQDLEEIYEFFGCVPCTNDINITDKTKITEALIKWG